MAYNKPMKLTAVQKDVLRKWPVEKRYYVRATGEDFKVFSNGTARSPNETANVIERLVAKGLVEAIKGPAYSALVGYELTSAGIIERQKLDARNG